MFVPLDPDRHPLHAIASLHTGSAKHRLRTLPRSIARDLHCSKLTAAADEVKQKLVEHGAYDPTLPKPGDIVHIDYRSPEAVAAAGHLDETRPLRVVQWNIERGYELDAAKTTLAELDADILLLQEIDIGCDRSDNRDVGAPPRSPGPFPGKTTGAPALAERGAAAQAARSRRRCR